MVSCVVNTKKASWSLIQYEDYAVIIKRNGIVVDIKHPNKYIKKEHVLSFLSKIVTGYGDDIYDTYKEKRIRRNKYNGINKKAAR